MIDFIKQFLVIFVVLFCIHMIYFYFRNKSKKYRNVLTIEMNYLTRIYGIDIKRIGINFIQKEISIVNSIIASIDLVIYYNIENAILKLFIVFITTFVLILISYSILGRKYRKFMR